MRTNTLNPIGVSLSCFTIAIFSIAVLINDNPLIVATSILCISITLQFIIVAHSKSYIYTCDNCDKELTGEDITVSNSLQYKKHYHFHCYQKINSLSKRLKDVI